LPSWRQRSRLWPRRMIARSADRAISAAERSGDAVLMAEGAFRLTLAFQSARQYAHVNQTASTAVDPLADRVTAGEPAAISLTGSLHLQMAITAVRQNLADEAYRHVDAAIGLARALGVDRNDYGTGVRSDERDTPPGHRCGRAGRRLPRLAHRRRVRSSQPVAGTALAIPHRAGSRSRPAPRHSRSRRHHRVGVRPRLGTRVWHADGAGGQPQWGRRPGIRL
jgi:hypothetical protein